MYGRLLAWGQARGWMARVGDGRLAGGRTGGSTGAGSVAGMTNPTDVNPPSVNLVSVLTRRRDDGTYGQILAVGQRERWVTREELVAHAVAVMGVVADVRHSASVLRHLTERAGLSWEDATAMVGSLAREPVDEEALHPVHLHGAVSETGEGYVVLMVDGEPAGELSVVQCVEHAVHCLLAPWVTPMERALVEKVTELEGGGDLSRLTAMMMLHGSRELQVPLFRGAGDE